jgi:NADH dehydrogenase FAD-containing subunit
VLLGEVTGINSIERIVYLKQGELPYDFLVLATGIQYNYFGHDEWWQFAPGLESLDDADVIRGKMCLRSSERKKWPRLPAARKFAGSSRSRSSERGRLESRWPALSLRCRE